MWGKISLSEIFFSQYLCLTASKLENSFAYPNDYGKYPEVKMLLSELFMPHPLRIETDEALITQVSKTDWSGLQKVINALTPKTLESKHSCFHR